MYLWFFGVQEVDTHVGRFSIFQRKNLWVRVWILFSKQVCADTCMYVHMHVCVYACVHACERERRRVFYTNSYTQYEVWDLCFELQSTHTYIYTYMYKCMYVCMYMYLREREREGEWGRVREKSLLCSKSSSSSTASVGWRGKQAFVREEEDKGQEGLMLQEMHPFGSVSFFLSFFCCLPCFLQLQECVVSEQCHHHFSSAHDRFPAFSPLQLFSLLFCLAPTRESSAKHNCVSLLSLT